MATNSELLASLPHQCWKNILQLTSSEANQIHNWVCGRAGEGELVTHRQLVDALGDTYRATAFETIYVLLREGLPVIYSFDHLTGEVCVELVSFGSL